MALIEMIWSGDVYRTQAERPMCHAAAVGRLPDGELVAAWYEGCYELDTDSVIMMTCTSGFGDWSSSPVDPPGWSWKPPGVAARIPGLAVGNPVVFAAPNGEVWLFFVIVYGATWTSSRIAVKRFAPGSLTQVWRYCCESAGNHGSIPQWPALVCDQPGWMTRNKLLVLPEGVWLLPVYDESLWCPMVLRSEDEGRSWRAYGDTTMPGVAIQPSIVELRDGRLLMLTRTSRGRIWRSFSYNRGLTWTVCQPTDLPNPDSGIDAVKTPSGRIVLAMNDLERGRDRLAVLVSDDDGASWTSRVVLDDSGGEVSYPAVIAGPNGLVHVLYTWQRIAIRHAILREL